MRNFNPIFEVRDDKLEIPEVGDWSFQKWGLLGSYCNIFTTGMRKKWDQLIYIDLFSSSGFAKIKGTDRIYYSSAFIAMSIPEKFDKYIFCEKDQKLLDSLKKRADRLYPSLNVSFILGDSNENVNLIKKEIPPFGKNNTLLAFCFVDPFSLDLHFNTIKTLAKGKMDFLILLALHMDAKRNLQYYIDENSDKIAFFVGDSNWRNEFQQFGTDGKAFIRYLAEKYDRNMSQLGYVKPETKHQVRSSVKNLPLYYLAFYSKHKRGNDFYKKIKKTATGQTELGL